MSFLRDPLWQFIGAAVAALALLVSIVAVVLQRGRKLLGYEVMTLTPVLTVREELQGRIKVLLDDEPVQELSLLVLRFSNRGNVPIRSDEYERPVTFTFGPKAQLVSAEITEQRPTNLGAEIISSAENVQLKPVLLNPRDVLELKCLVTGDLQLSCDARVVGITMVREVTSKDSPHRALVSLAGAVLVIVGVIGLTRYSAPPPELSPTRLLESLSGVTLSFGLALLLFPFAKRLLVFRGALPRRDHSRSSSRTAG